MKSYPNRAVADSEYTWFPKDAEDDIDFRRFPYNRELSEDEFEELDDENLNDVESYDEKRSNFRLPSVTNYKRDPNSVSIPCFALNLTCTTLYLNDSYFTVFLHFKLGSAERKAMKGSLE